MDTTTFKRAYNESRNGANFFVRHWFAGTVQFSGGVQECADAGCHWLLDIIATELPQVLRGRGSQFGVVTVTVAADNAHLALVVEDEMTAWSRLVEWTDMPEGEWLLYIVDEGSRFALILPTEY